MRKLILEEWVSLDGYVSDKNGKLDFFTHTVRETYLNEDRLQFLETIDCILMGRTTYEQFVKLWPQRPIENDLLAEKINTGSKIIFSNSLKDAPWGQWPKAEIASGNAISKIKQIKSLPGKDMVLWGSISLAQALMKENQIDVYRLHLCPALTAGGKRLFTEEMSAANLELVETKHYRNGLVFLTYAIAPQKK